MDNFSKIVFFIFLFFYVQFAFSETSSSEDLFGEQIPTVVSKQNSEYLWSSKKEFDDSILNGAMVDYVNENNYQKKKKINESIIHLLEVEYKTPFDKKIEQTICGEVFKNSINSLLFKLTNINVMNYSNSPPDFVVQKDEQLLRKLEQEKTGGKMIMQNLNNTCRDEKGVKDKTYPFVSSLYVLMKDYDKLTANYLEQDRVKKVETYKIAKQKKEEQEVANKLEIEAAAAKKAQELAAQENRKNQERLAEETRRKLNREQQEKNEEALRTREAQEKERIATCQKTKEYKKYFYAQSVELNKSYIDFTNEKIKNENEIGRVSGFVDAEKLHKYGSDLLDYQRGYKESLQLYKEIGGTEPTSKVVAGKNPCE